MIPVASAHDHRRPTILPPDSRPYGNTYAEWSARWWQWLLAIPTPENPNLDTTGQHCDEGQAGPVWFLAGAFGPPAPVIGTRICTVPVGKALLLPLTNTLYGAGAFDCTPTNPGVDCDLNALRQLAAADIDARVPLPAVEIDGIPVENVDDFRFQSPVITLTYPADNVVSFLFNAPVPAGTYTPNVSDGYFLILAPLSKGEHTIRLNGQVIWILTVMQSR
jgi:hypothetical protein